MNAIAVRCAGSVMLCGLLMGLFGDVTLVRAQNLTVGATGWKEEFRDPLWVPVKFQAVFNAIGTLNVTLGGRLSTGTNYSSVCGEGWTSTVQATANLMVWRTYLLAVSGTNVYGFEAELLPPAVNDLLDRGGRNGNQYKRYRLYIKNWETEEWERLTDLNRPAYDTEVDSDGTCHQVTRFWEIQVRPAHGARPVSVSKPKQVRGDDQGDESWSKDEDPLMGADAPGDAGPFTLRAGRSDDPAACGLRWDVLLGRLWTGDSAGKIRFLASRLSTNSFTPLILNYSPRSYNSNELEVVRLTNSFNQIRQIKAPQTFVNVITNSTSSFELRFYLPSAVGEKDTNGLYTLTGSPSPFVTWLFESGDGSTNQLRLTESRADRTNVSLIAFNPGTSVWTHQRGTGAEAQLETRTVVIDQNNRIETIEFKNGLGQVSDKTIEVYGQFEWGYELVTVTNDAGGANLVTTLSYCTDSNSLHNYKRLDTVQHPDGFWEKRQYSAELYEPYQPFGSLTNIIHPWMDSLLSEASATGLQTGLTYTDLVEGSFILRKCFYDYSEMDLRMTFFESTWFNDDGWIEIEKRHFGAEGSYAEGAVTATYSDGADALNGQVFSRWNNVGWLESYDYQSGSYNPTNHTFTGGPTGSDLRKVIYRGTDPDADLDGDRKAYGDSGEEIDPIRLKTAKATKEVLILKSGLLACREQHVYLGNDQFALTDRIVYARDTLGHATNVTRIDPATAAQRVLYTADWKGAAPADSNRKLWETDETGVQKIYAYDSLDRIKSITRKGVSVGSYPVQGDIVESFAHDAVSRVLTNMVSGGSLSATNVYVYDKAGRLTSHRTSDGLTTTLTYGAGGQFVTNTFSSGAKRIVTNYPDRRPASVTGTAEVNQCFDYGHTGDVASGLRPSNITTTVLGTNGAPRWAMSITDRRGRLAQERRPGFQSANHLVRTYDMQGPGGLVDRVKQTNFEISGTPLADIQHLIQYNAYGERILEGLDADRDGVIWSASIDRLTTNCVYFETNALGHWFKVSERSAYLTDSTSTPTLLETVKERLTGFFGNDAAESLHYDATNSLTLTKVTIDRANKKVTNALKVPESTLTAFQVSVNGLLQTETTPSVSTAVWHYYDSLGRQIAVRDARGFTWGTTYDPATGQVTARTNDFQQVTRYAYYPPGSANAGLLYSETGPTGKKRYFQYNSRGQLTHTWGDVPYPEKRDYSIYGELVGLTTYRTEISGWKGTNWPASPPAGDLTQWFFDGPTGLLTNKTDAAGRSVTFTYYNNHLPRTRTWARAGSITATNLYSSIGDLIGIEYSDSTPEVAYANHDRRGLPRSITDVRGDRTLTYDVFGRVKQDTGTSGTFNGINLVNNFHAFYGRTNLQLQIPGQSTIQHDYGYHFYGRLSSAAYGTYSVAYAYQPYSDLLQASTFKQSTTTKLTTTRFWEGSGRLRAIQNVGLGTVSSHTYAYDPLNRRIAATLADLSTWVYDYNDRDELIDAKRVWPDWTPAAGQQFAFAYDPIGNRTTAKSGGDANGLNLRATTYTRNNLNQYSTIVTAGYKDILGVAWATNTVTVNGLDTDRKGEYFHRELTVANSSGPVWGSVTVTNNGVLSTNGNFLFPKYSQNPTWDLDGNLTFDGIWTYAWDAENRLIDMAITNVTGIPNSQRKRLQFTYDHLGRRVTRTVSTWNGSSFTSPVTTKFAYDGWNLLAEINNSNVPQRSYLWGKDLSGQAEPAPNSAGGIGGLVAVRDHGAGTYHFAAYDGNGNLTALVNAADQSVSAQYEYSPFGDTLRATGPLSKTNPFRFSTKFTDEDSGLVYYGYRYYSPTQGRWINRDPIEEEGGVNLYAYALNNPVNVLDPFGLSTLAEEESAVGTAATLEGAGGNATAIGFKQLIKRAVQNFSDFQEIAFHIWDLAEAMGLPNADFMLMDALDKGNKAFSDDLTSYGKKRGPGWQAHHVGTNKGKHSWNAAFRGLFRTVGMDIDGPGNIVPLVDHRGRHSVQYHDNVFKRLSEGWRMGGKRGFIRALINVRKDLLAGAIAL